MTKFEIPTAYIFCGDRVGKTTFAEAIKNSSSDIIIITHKDFEVTYEEALMHINKGASIIIDGMKSIRDAEKIAKVLSFNNKIRTVIVNFRIYA